MAMKELERELGLGDPAQGERREKIIALLGDRLAPRLVWCLKRADRKGATADEVLHWLRLARKHIRAALGNRWILSTTEVLHVLLQMITNMVVAARNAARAVGESAPPVQLSEPSVAGVLKALEELGGEAASFAAGVKDACKGRERLAPGVYECAVGVVIATAAYVLTHPRVLATPNLPGIVLWLLAVVLRKIRPEALKSAKTARARREHRHAAQGLVLLAEGVPNPEADGSPEPAGGAKRARSGDDTDDEGDGSPGPARGKRPHDDDGDDTDDEGDGSPEPARGKREGSPEPAGDAKKARNAQ